MNALWLNKARQSRVMTPPITTLQLTSINVALSSIRATARRTSDWATAIVASANTIWRSVSTIKGYRFRPKPRRCSRIATRRKKRVCYAAIHDLDKLTEMQPNNAALYFRKANLYLMDHASEQANENFRRASELEPTNLTYGMRAAHPVLPVHQYTTEELKEKLTNGLVGAVVGAFALGAMADHAQEQRVKNLIESSGGRKIRCPKCNGYGQIRTESSEMVSTNPYPELTNEWQKYEESSIFSTKQLRMTTHIADCDRCGGTGVVDK